jgi:hypothetical protein
MDLPSIISPWPACLIRTMRRWVSCGFRGLVQEAWDVAVGKTNHISTIFVRIRLRWWWFPFVARGSSSLLGLPLASGGHWWYLRIFWCSWSRHRRCSPGVVVAPLAFPVPSPRCLATAVGAPFRLVILRSSFGPPCYVESM